MSLIKNKYGMIIVIINSLHRDISLAKSDINGILD